MRATAVAPAPWTRACALAGCSTLLAGAAHTGTGGGAVPPLLLAVLAVGLVPVVRAWLDREASAVALLAVVSGVQVALHVVLGWSALTAAPPSADTGPMAGHGAMTDLPGALASVVTPPSGWMLAAHAAAVLVVVAVLRHAESALCSAVRVARSGATRLPLVAAVRLAVAALSLPTMPETPTGPGRVDRPERTAGPQPLLHDVLTRRGPPVPVS